MRFRHSWLALKELLTRLGRSLKKNFLIAALISVGWALLGFVWTFWSLAVIQEGSDPQRQTLTTALRNSLNKTEWGRELLANESLQTALQKWNTSDVPYWFDLRNFTPHTSYSDGSWFWTFLPLLASFAFGYLWTAGPRKFVGDLFRLPSALLGILRKDPANALVHILWGAGVGLLITRTLNPMLQAGLLLTLTATLPSVLGQTLSRFVTRVIFDLVRLVRPSQEWKENNAATVAIAAIGGILALVLATLLHPEQLISRFTLGWLLIIAAAVTAGYGRSKTAATVLLVLGVGLEVDWALAHDGGWKEAFRDGRSPDFTRENLDDYLESGGADVVVGISQGAGATAGAASGAGTVLGGAAGEGGMGWDQPGTEEEPSGEEPYNEDHQRILDDLWQEVDNDEFMSRVESIFDRIEQTGNIDPGELARLQADWERELDRRRAEIDAEHERWSDEQRRKREEREAEAQGRRDEAAAQERRRQDLLRRGRGLIGQVEDPVRAQQLEDFLDRHAHDPDALEDALGALRTQIYEAEQERLRGEAEEAQAEEEAYRESEDYARSVRDNAQRANRGLARVVPGGSRIVAAQSAIYGGVEDYERDGVRGVFTGAATNMVDDHTGGLGSAIRDARNHGGSAGERARNAASNWWHNATDDKNPIEIGRRVANAGSLGEVIDAGLDAADASDDWRGDGGGDHHDPEPSRERPRGDAEPSPRRPRGDNPDPTPARERPRGDQHDPTPPRERPRSDRHDPTPSPDGLGGVHRDPTPPRDDHDSRRPEAPQTPDSSRPSPSRDNDSSSQPEGSRTPQRGPLYDADDPPAHDPATHNQTPPDPYRNPDPPADPNDPDYQRRVQQAQQARNTWAETEQAQLRESEAHQRLGQAEWDRDDARNQALASRQEMARREAEAQAARQQAEQAAAEAQANQQAVDDARRDVLSPEPIPGAVDRYEEAQRRQAELDARAQDQARQADEADSRSTRAQEEHQQRAQDLRQASEAEEQARREHEQAQQQAQTALDQQRAGRDPRHELEQADIRVEQAQQALTDAHKGVDDARNSERDGDRARAQDSLIRAQEQLARSQAEQQRAQSRLDQHRAMERSRQQTADQAHRDAQARRGVNVNPLADPGSHQEVTEDRLRTERAKEDGAKDKRPEVPVTRVEDPTSGVTVAIDPSRQSHPDAVQGSEPLPHYDGRNVRGQHTFDEQGRPSSVTTDHEGTRLHERGHSHAHPGFRTLLPAGSNDTRNLHEGLNEYFTQQALADQNNMEDRSRVYPRQVRAVEHLARRVGNTTLAEAYYNGNTQPLLDRFGGEPNFHRYSMLLRDGKYAEARQFLDDNLQ